MSFRDRKIEGNVLKVIWNFRDVKMDFKERRKKVIVRSSTSKN